MAIKDAPYLPTAIIGCGFVADLYMQSSLAYPNMPVKGAFDISEERLKQFCHYHSVNAYAKLDNVLSDHEVKLIINLTNPRSHHAVTQTCLSADKHVYSEKPLAMTLRTARALTSLANERKLRLSCAPCSVLSNTAQTVWKAIKEGAIGKVRLVYANYDDGMIAPQMSPWLWRSRSGANWPSQDEFETGCTYEHAGYILTWLAAFFGPARNVTSFSSCQITDKGIAVNNMAPDFTVGCIEYDAGIVARVTCSLIAPRDKSLLIIGDDGILLVKNLRNDSERVYIRKIPTRGNLRRLEDKLNLLQKRFSSLLQYLPWPIEEFHLYRKYPFACKDSYRNARPRRPVDFWRGPYDVAQAIHEGRPHRLSAELSVHIVELIEALQYPKRFDNRRVIESTFPPIMPLHWRP